MKLEVLAVHAQGGFDDEYVDLKVLESCDLNHYMLADTTYRAGGGISNRFRHTYWFGPREVNRGDFVRLFTRPRRETDADRWKNGSCTTTHAFYWGLRSAVWNNTGDGAILFEIATWNTTRV